MGSKELANNGLGLTPVPFIVGGLIAGVLFIWRQRLRPRSLIDIELFRLRAFSGSIAVDVLAMVAIVGFAVFLTQYLQLVLGMSTLKAALWSLVPSLATGGIAPSAAAIGQKVNRAYVISGGFLIAAVGFAVLTEVRATSPLWLVLAGATAYAGGLVAVLALVTGIVVGVAPPERASSASALLESGTEFGGALGIAILGSIGNAVYHRDIARLPSSVPPGALSAARQTLAGATVAAAKLPASLGGQVLKIAREAFVSGLNAAAITMVVVMVGTAVLATVLLRQAGKVPVTKKNTTSAGPSACTRPAWQTRERDWLAAVRDVVVRLPNADRGRRSSAQ